MHLFTKNNLMDISTSLQLCLNQHPLKTRAHVELEKIVYLSILKTTASIFHPTGDPLSDGIFSDLGAMQDQSLQQKIINCYTNTNCGTLVLWTTTEVALSPKPLMVSFAIVYNCFCFSNLYRLICGGTTSSRCR